MPWLRQLEFAFGQAATAVATEQTVCVGQALRLPNLGTATDVVALQCPECDAELEKIARDLLRAHGATRIARELRIEWNSRLKTAAGRADYCQKLISLNPLLLEHSAEIDRTLRHELAHILPQDRKSTRLSSIH